MLTLWRHYMTLNSLSMCHICKNGPGVITISLNDHGSKRFEQIWRVYNVFEFSPLTYLRTWPQVNHIRIPRYTRCRYRMVYQISCDFEIIISTTVAVTRLQTFLEIESLDLAWWPELGWPGVRFFTKCAKKCQNGFCFALSWKNLGKGGKSNTPSRAQG